MPHCFCGGAIYVCYFTAYNKSTTPVTEIVFHHGIAERQDYLCHLLRKAYVSGTCIVVFGESDALPALSKALWKIDTLEFIPHACCDSSAAEKAYSPIYLTSALHEATHHQAILNTTTQIPSGFERFDKLLEVVTQDTEDKKQARARLAFYKQRGYRIAYHSAHA